MYIYMYMYMYTQNTSIYMYMYIYKVPINTYMKNTCIHVYIILAYGFPDSDCGSYVHVFQNMLHDFDATSDKSCFMYAH